MLKTFYHDITYLSKEKILAKYGVPLMRIIIPCIIIGKLIIMFVPLSQLAKVTGHLTYVGKKEVGRNSNDGSTEYALGIVVDNSHSYTIMDKNDTAKLAKTLKVGDLVTIYYPTALINFLGPDAGSDISQIERGQQIIYSWKNQQQKGWIIIGICVVLFVLSWYAKLYWDREIPPKPYETLT